MKPEARVLFELMAVTKFKYGFEAVPAASIPPHHLSRIRISRPIAKPQK